MMENEDNAEEQLSMEILISSPILDFAGEAELFPEALLQTSEDSCSCADVGDRNSGIIDPNYAYEEGSIASVLSAYYPSTDASNFSALMGAQPALDTEPGEFAECLQQQQAAPPFPGTEEQLDNMVSMAFSADEYSPDDSAGQLLNVPPPLPPPPLSLCHPQQISLAQSFYDDGERFLLPMASAAAAAETMHGSAYLAMDSGMGSLFNGGIGLPLCGGGGGGSGRVGKGFFPADIMPMQFPEMEYQSMAVGVFNMENTFQQNGYCSNDLQLLLDTPLQKQTNNSSLVVACSSPTPLASDITALDESTFKVGRLSAEERKEKINKYLKKRKERNFSKKIKYACRKTLADSRPRVRGRFAKNEDFGEGGRPGTGNHDYEDEDEVLVKDEDSYYDF